MTSTKVIVLTQPGYESYTVLGVFSDREAIRNSGIFKQDDWIKGEDIHFVELEQELEARNIIMHHETIETK